MVWCYSFEKNDLRAKKLKLVIVLTMNPELPSKMLIFRVIFEIMLYHPTALLLHN